MDQPPTGPERFAAVLHFLRSTASGGLYLGLAALAALLWANSPAALSYTGLLRLPIGLNAGRLHVALPFVAWVNEALMALFFLQVGLEIRREMTQGELASWRRVAAPGLAALGGMVVPACLYLALNAAYPAARSGWAIPVATDIAFALAALSLLGRRAPVALKLFLTALAILDDLGAILVIALFYTAGLNWPALAVSGAVLAAMWLLARSGVRVLWPFLLGGAVLWVAVQRSGVHATLAGVALAFVVPATGAHSAAARLEHALGGWVAFLILPVFGLANAGLDLSSVGPGTLSDPIFLGIAGGLLLGKPIGVFGAAWLACRVHLAKLPRGLTFPMLAGGSLLCGIGFTMSLFIGNLAFPGGTREAEVKLAVFGASLLAAILGIAVLLLCHKPGRP